LVKEIGGGLYYLDDSEVEYECDGSVRNLNGICIMTSNNERVKPFIEKFNKLGVSLD